jgi:hypothetical protein
MRHLIRTAVQFPVGELLVFKDYGNSIGGSLDLGFKQLMDK